MVAGALMEKDKDPAEQWGPVQDWIKQYLMEHPLEVTTASIICIPHIFLFFRTQHSCSGQCAPSRPGQGSHQKELQHVGPVGLRTFTGIAL